MKTNLWTLLLLAAGSASAKSVRKYHQRRSEEIVNLSEPELVSELELIEPVAPIADPVIETATLSSEDLHDSVRNVVDHVAEKVADEVTEVAMNVLEDEDDDLEKEVESEPPLQNRQFNGNELEVIKKTLLDQPELAANNPILTQEIMHNSDTKIDAYYEDDGEVHFVVRVPNYKKKISGTNSDEYDEQTHEQNEDYEVEEFPDYENAEELEGELEPNKASDEEVDIVPEISVEATTQAPIILVQHDSLPDETESDNVDVIVYENEEDVVAITVRPVEAPPTNTTSSEDIGIVVPDLVNVEEDLEEPEVEEVEIVTQENVIVAPLDGPEEELNETDDIVVIETVEKERLVKTESEEPVLTPTPEEPKSESDNLVDLPDQFKDITNPKNYWLIALILFCCFI